MGFQTESFKDFSQSVCMHEIKKQDLYYLTFNLFIHLSPRALSKTAESTGTIVCDCALFPYDLPLILKTRIYYI